MTTEVKSATVATLMRIAPGQDLASLLAPWLLLGRPPEEGGSWTFRTTSFDGGLVTTKNGTAMLMRNDDLVIPLRKRAGSVVAKDTILVGRAASNDVAVAHSSVSKLHARFELAGGDIFLADAGSSNGTWLGEQQLAPHQRVRLVSGAVVKIGMCAFHVVSAADLAHLLWPAVRQV